MPQLLEYSQLLPAQRDLSACETIIEQGKKPFLKVCAAFERIRERQLYLGAGCGDWDEYVAKRWGLDAMHIDRMIQLGKSASDASVSILDLPVDIDQDHVAELECFPADMRATIYDTARQTAPGGKLTPAWIEQTGRRLLDARLAALNEAKKNSLAEDDEEVAPGEEGETITGDQQTIRDTAQHPLTLAEWLAKREKQGKRSVLKVERIAVDLGCSPVELFGRYSSGAAASLWDRICFEEGAGI